MIPDLDTYDSEGPLPTLRARVLDTDAGKLAAALIEHAVDDLASTKPARWRAEQDWLQRRAERAGSFRWCCAVLDVDPVEMRRGVRALADRMREIAKAHRSVMIRRGREAQQSLPGIAA